MITPDDKRLRELAGILAIGLARLRQREQQHCSSTEKVGLDFTGDQSVCATVSEAEERARWQGEQT